MTFCGNPRNANGRPLASRHRCLKKGVGIGIGIGKVALRLGHGLTLAEVNSLSKDVLRDIGLRRKRRGLSTSIGAMSRKSKATLKEELLTDLRRTNKLKQ